MKKGLLIAFIYCLGSMGILSFPKRKIKDSMQSKLLDWNKLSGED